MKVVVVGGSGVVGMRVALQLARQKREVTAVAFRPDSVELLQRMGLRAVRADVRDRGSLYAPLDGADLVINATVSVPCDPARVRFCGEVAEAGLGHVAEVVRQLGVPRLVSCSLLRSAAPSDGSFFDEESVPLTAGEEKARAALDKSGDTRQVVVRLGEVYSGDGQAWQILAQALHEAKAPILGDGNGMRQVIHSDDAAAALVALATDMLESEYPVTVANNFRVLHLCDGVGVSSGAILRILAAAIGAPAPRQLPLFLARMAGALTEETIAAANYSAATDCARLRRLLPEWQPRVPSFEAGAAQMRSFWASVPATRHLVKN